MVISLCDYRKQKNKSNYQKEDELSNEILNYLKTCPLYELEIVCNPNNKFYKEYKRVFDERTK